MKLVSLKNAQDESTCYAMPMENYGYGLRIHLNDAQCEALGITKALAAGTQVKVSAQAIVVSSTQSVDTDGDGGNDIQLDLQITDMGLEAGGVLRNAAQVLYGGD
jgi:hypothetical protein